jgi:hypothetical protein
LVIFHPTALDLNSPDFSLAFNWVLLSKNILGNKKLIALEIKVVVNIFSANKTREDVLGSLGQSVTNLSGDVIVS